MRFNGSKKYKLNPASGTTARGIWPVVQKFYASIAGGTSWPSKTGALSIFNWTATSSTSGRIDYDNYYGSTTYQIQVYKDGVPLFIVNNGGARLNSIAITGLSPNTTYSFTVAYVEIDKAYPATMSNSVSFTTCLAYGTPAGDICNGYSLYNGICDGNCGVITSGNSKQDNSPSCGFYDQNGGINSYSSNPYGSYNATWLNLNYYYDSSGNNLTYSYCDGNWGKGDNKYGCYTFCFGGLCAYWAYCTVYIEIDIDGSAVYIEDHNGSDFGFWDGNYSRVCRDYNTCPSFCI